MSMRPSREGNPHANGWNRVKIKVVWDLMPVLVIYKFDEDLFENEFAIVRTIFSPFYVYRRLKGK